MAAADDALMKKLLSMETQTDWSWIETMKQIQQSQQTPRQSATPRNATTPRQPVSGNDRTVVSLTYFPYFKILRIRILI